MPTYVTLSHFTDQGIKGIKDTVKRSEAFKTGEQAKSWCGHAASGMG
jgi:uncharacterized protein with GYD domain